MSSINVRTKCPARSVVSISFAKSKNFCSKFLADAAAVADAAQVGAVRGGAVDGVTIGAPGGAPNVDGTAAHDGAPDVEADADPVEDRGRAGGDAGTAPSTGAAHGDGAAAHAGAAEAGAVRGGSACGGAAQVGVDAIDDDDVAPGNRSGAAMCDNAGVASAGRLVGSPDI